MYLFYSFLIYSSRWRSSRYVPVFFSLFLFIEHRITHRFYGKKFRFEKKNAWQLTTYAFDRIKNYNAITVRLAFNFVCVKQICHQEEVRNVANVLILIVHELTEYIQK